MTAKMTLCEHCRKEVNYIETDLNLNRDLQGETYNFIGKKALCSQCSVEVYVAETEDYNLKALYDAYRIKSGMITLREILEIPVMYTIDKQPLSLLLGWGEMTFTRYCDGDMPTKQHSDLLKQIHNEPHFFLSVLEKNKATLTSNVAYTKSKNKLNTVLKLQKRAASKIDHVIDYLLVLCEDMTPLALQKALYYIQGFHYAFTKTFLFEQDCEAWQNGPVYRDIDLRYTNYSYDPTRNALTLDSSLFTASEKAVIDNVIKNLCCYSGKILEDFTHSETPWIMTRGDLPDSDPSDKIIDKVLIGDYFMNVKQKYNMLKPTDIECYSKEMFEQIH